MCLTLKYVYCFNKLTHFIYVYIVCSLVYILTALIGLAILKILYLHFRSYGATISLGSDEKEHLNIIFIISCVLLTLKLKPFFIQCLWFSLFIRLLCLEFVIEVVCLILFAFDVNICEYCNHNTKISISMFKECKI